MAVQRQGPARCRTGSLSGVNAQPEENEEK